GTPNPSGLFELLDVPVFLASPWRPLRLGSARPGIRGTMGTPPTQAFHRVVSDRAGRRVPHSLFPKTFSLCQYPGEVICRTRNMATSQESPLSILEGVPKAGNRRRHVRQKVHSPAYASFDGIGGGMVLDLTEVLNLCEGGMAIQANAALDVNRTLNLVLDLSETKSYVNATGMVVWTGKSGVAGIRFSRMADAPPRHLKEWLFHNALTAAAKAVQRPAEDALPAPVQAPLPTGATTQPKSDSSIEEPTEEVPSAPVLLTADAPTLNIIQQEVEALGSNVDAALRLLVQRSQALTRASGAAIALAQGTEMVCRASSGDAPPLGAKLQIGSGFSGACVRTAKMQRCDDSDTNPLVDRESCRQLGIRSMIAAPIVTNGVVIGLLEVFSPSPFSFGEGDATALQRL